MGSGCNDQSAKIATTVDGRNRANPLRLVVSPIIDRVLYIAGGCLGFLPSTVLIEKHLHHGEKPMEV